MHILREYLQEQETKQKVLLFEHKVYRSIPGTKSSYREDPGNTNTLTMKHAHVYASPKGGRLLYSVNIDGSGHDGSSGQQIPSEHANFFRKQGFDINPSNILESLNINNLNAKQFALIILSE